jgi:hypothetical protein
VAILTQMSVEEFCRVVEIMYKRFEDTKVYKKKAKKKAKTKTKIVNYNKKIIKTTYYIKCPLYVLDFKRLFLHG